LISNATSLLTKLKTLFSGHGVGLQGASNFRCILKRCRDIAAISGCSPWTKVN